MAAEKQVLLVHDRSMKRHFEPYIEELRLSGIAVHATSELDQVAGEMDVSAFKLILIQLAYLTEYFIHDPRNNQASGAVAIARRLRDRGVTQPIIFLNLGELSIGNQFNRPSKNMEVVHLDDALPGKLATICADRLQRL